MYFQPNFNIEAPSKQTYHLSYPKASTLELKTASYFRLVLTPKSTMMRSAIFIFLPKLNKALNNPANHLPISLLCTLSKVAEA